MFTSNIVPGQGFQKFHIYVQEATVTASGRAVHGKPADTGDVFFGMLINASQREIDQWKQNGHPISHKVVEYSAMVKAGPTQYLVNEAGREFYVQGVKNPADMNISCIYYVEERLDVDKID